jgi:hypothetical protein
MILEQQEKRHDNSEKKADELLPVAELYPELDREQQEKAGYFLNRFLDVMLRICEENEEKKGD